MCWEMAGVPQLVLVACTGWSSLYIILRHVVTQSPEWTIRVVTLVHALLVTALSVLDWAWLRPWDINYLGEKNTRYEEVVLSLTLGYFLFDFAWVVKHQTEGPTMYIHHATSIVCVSYILLSGVSAAEALLGVSLLEGTNPCLQTRWFLRTHGLQATVLHTLTEAAFILAFLALRVAYGSYLMLNILHSERLHPLFKLGTVSLHLVSLVFVYQMFNYISKKYFANEKKKEK